MITKYDKEQLRAAQRMLTQATKITQWVLDGDPDAAVRCAHAAHLAYDACVLLDRSDRRIGWRKRRKP